MPCGVEDVIKEFESVQYSYPYSYSYSPSSIPVGSYSPWTSFDPETLEVVDEDPLAAVVTGCSSSDQSSLSVPGVQGLEFGTLSKSHNSGVSTSISSSNISVGGDCRNKSCCYCQVKGVCSHHKINNNSTHGEDLSNLNTTNNSFKCFNSCSIRRNNNTSGTIPQESEQLEFESVSLTTGTSSSRSVNQLLDVKGSNTNNHHQEFCESSPGGPKDLSNAPGSFLLTTFPWSSSRKDQQHLENCNRPSTTNCNQINMSSSVSCGVSSSSIFGGLCSGNTRRPSMFTAKYRLREERKKVLKMSLAKVKKIEDPECVLRRSVLINNTIKKLQKEVREEKMMRHGGSYTSKLSCSSFRKSFASSRLNEMHLSVVDEPDTTNSLLGHDDPLLPSRSSSSSLSSPLDNLVISKDHHNSPSMINSSRKRQLNQDDSEDDCDVQAVLSQIYIPPTPRIISSIDEDDHHNNHCDSHLNHLSASPSTSSRLCGENECSTLSKKPRLSSPMDVDLNSMDVYPTTSLLTEVTGECSLDDDVDVDVVGDSEMSDWPTPPPPSSMCMSMSLPPPPQLPSTSLFPSSSSSMLLSPVTSSMPLSLSSSIIPSSNSLSPVNSNVTSCSNSLLNTSPYATGLGRVMTVMSDSPNDFPLMVDNVPPVTRDSSESCPSPSLTVSTSYLATNMPTIVSPSSLCNGLMSPLPLGQIVSSSSTQEEMPMEEEIPSLVGAADGLNVNINIVSSSSSEEDSSSSSSSSSDEDMTLSSETKENTCSLPLSLPLSGIHSPLQDRNSKCSDLSSSANNNNANGINNNNNVNGNNNSTGEGTDKQQQYSSCGHSSIFGELQSVVFHSLIASLES